jgi:hypothetical protein
MKILVKLLELIKSRSTADRQAMEDMAKVRVLLVEVAKQRALELVADPRRFECVTGGFSNNPAIERLGPRLLRRNHRLASLHNRRKTSFSTESSLQSCHHPDGFLVLSRRGGLRFYLCDDPPGTHSNGFCSGVVGH